ANSLIARNCNFKIGARVRKLGFKFNFVDGIANSWRKPKLDRGVLCHPMQGIRETRSTNSDIGRWERWMKRVADKIWTIEVGLALKPGPNLKLGITNGRVVCDDLILTIRCLDLLPCHQ